MPSDRILDVLSKARLLEIIHLVRTRGLLEFTRSAFKYIINKILYLKAFIIFKFVLNKPIHQEELVEIARTEKIRPVPSPDSVYPLDSVPEKFDQFINIDYSKKTKYCYGLSNVKLWGEAADTNIIMYHRRPVLESTQGSMKVFQRYVKNIIDRQGLIKSVVFLLEFPLLFNLVTSDKFGRKFDMTNVDLYYGLIVNELPKLESYEKSSLTDDIDLLIPHHLPSWAGESLELLGYESEVRTKWKGQNAEVKDLYFSSRNCYSPFEGYGFNLDPNNRRWLRKQALSNISTPSKDQCSSKVYISRSDANERRVTNESELVNVISELGFERYVLSKLDFKTQVQLFNQANVVVGPHGAGFANIIFVEELNVIEMFNSDDHFEFDIRPYYFALTCELGFDHRYIMCEGEDHDMKCDIGEVVEIIK